VASLVVGNPDFDTVRETDLVRETEVVRETVLVNGIVVAIPEIVRETEVDLVNGLVVAIPDLDLVTLGDLDLETLILYVLVDIRVVAGADRLGVLETDMV
jgi:hypothetical protein